MLAVLAVLEVLAALAALAALSLPDAQLSLSIERTSFNQHQLKDYASKSTVRLWPSHESPGRCSRCSPIWRNSLNDTNRSHLRPAHNSGRRDGMLALQDPGASTCSDPKAANLQRSH